MSFACYGKMRDKNHSKLSTTAKNWVLEYTFYVKGKFQGGHILISHVRRYTLLPYNTAILDLTLILNYNLKSH